MALVIMQAFNALTSPRIFTLTKRPLARSSYFSSYDKSKFHFHRCSRRRSRHASLRMAANCDKTVVKSPSDNRQYRILHLANGLTAVLVHDPQISAGSLMPSENDSPKFDNNDDDSYEDDEEEDDEEKEAALSTNFLAENGRLPRVPVGAVVSIKKAAAAMCVGMGSFSDPLDAQGLAHFLEEEACIHELHECLETLLMESHFFFFRFSQFFVSPLMKSEAMEREVQAVDSEFNQALQNDSCRLQQLQCHTAEQGHPFKRFTWGNRKSLMNPKEKGIDMRIKMLDLYKEYYLAGRMKLAIIGGGVEYEPWFGVPYLVKDIPSLLMLIWRNPPVIDQALHMPARNEFIPHDFSLQSPNYLKIQDSLDLPRIIIDDPSIKVWYKLDQAFQVPRANTYFLETLKGAYENIRACVLTELYVNLLEDTLNETLYKLYFQIEQDAGRESTRARAMGDLFEDIVQEPYFDQLRTKEQLGYVVDCGVRMTHRVLGFCFRVQSSRYAPPYIQEHLDAFIDKLQKVLVRCFDCKEYGSLANGTVRCSYKNCQNYFHEECSKKWETLKRAKASVAKRGYTCPHHFCHACRRTNNSGSWKLVRCLRCPVAYHSKCCPEGANILQDIPFLLCWKHDDADQEAGPKNNPMSIFKQLPVPDITVDFQIPDGLKKRKAHPYTFIKRNVYLTKKSRKRFEDDDGMQCSCRPSSTGPASVCDKDCLCGFIQFGTDQQCYCGAPDCRRILLSLADRSCLQKQL